MNPELNALVEAVNQLPFPVRVALAPKINDLVVASARRKRCLELVQEAIAQLRLDVKYMAFDLEATRRERDEARGVRGMMYNAVVWDTVGKNDQWEVELLIDYELFPARKSHDPFVPADEATLFIQDVVISELILEGTGENYTYLVSEYGEAIYKQIWDRIGEGRYDEELFDHYERTGR